MSDKKFDYSEVFSNESFRIELYNLISNINKENEKETISKINKILETDTKKRIIVVCDLIRIFGILHYEKSDSISEIIISIFSLDFAKPMLDYFLHRIVTLAKTHRCFNYIIGKLIHKQVLPDESIYSKIIKPLTKELFNKRATLFGIVFISTLLINCYEYMQEKQNDLLFALNGTIESLLNTLPSKQAQHFKKQFLDFIERGDKTPSKWFTILINDDADSIPDEGLDPETTFYPELCDKSPLAFCPSLIAAAAFFNANKCVEKLYKLGFSPDKEDQIHRSMCYYAGMSGNIRSLEIVGKTEERIKTFAYASIIHHRNEAFIASGYNGLFDEEMTSLHVAAQYNNYELVTKLMETIDVNVKDEFDDLPQHSAASYGSAESMLALAKSPSFDVEARNFCDMSSLELAVKNLSANLADLLHNSMKATVDKVKINNIIDNDVMFNEVILEAIGMESAFPSTDNE